MHIYGVEDMSDIDLVHHGGNCRLHMLSLFYMSRSATFAELLETLAADSRMVHALS